MRRGTVGRLRFIGGLLGCLTCAVVHGQAWEKSIAPGVTYRMEVDLAIPRIVHAIRYSFGAPGISLRSELGGGTIIEENSSKGRETVSEMVTRTGALVGINADFFPFTGDPLGVMVKDGQLLSTPTKPRAVFAWGARSAGIGLVDFKGTAEVNGQTIDLKGINEECPLNEAILNTDIAAFAMAKTPCVHAVIKMDSPDWAPNGTFTGTFENVYADTPKIPIQPGNAILTANGVKAALLKSLIPGDKVTFKFETKGFDWSKVDQIVGGGPFLVRGGQIAVDADRQGFNDAFSLKRHPRTAIGRTADGDIWMVVVDGRQKMSDGATLPETARLMQRLGCIDAINLDGGGSSALNILGLTLNRPSDGKERPVANGVVILGAKPDVWTAPLQIRAPEKLVLGQAKTFFVMDGGGNVIPNAEVLWSAMGEAWIDQGGLVRPVQKGNVEVAAYVRGQLLRVMIEVAEPEKVVVAKTKPAVSRGGVSRQRTRSKRGG